MKFHATLLQSGKSATGIQVPPEVVEQFGSGKRPAVSVALRGHTYRSTIAPMGRGVHATSSASLSRCRLYAATIRLLIEEGTLDALLERNRRYARSYPLQLGGVHKQP